MADSVSEAVGDAAKATIDALAIPKPGVTPVTAVPCVKRKTPSVPEGEQKGLPQVVVSVGETGEIQKIDAFTDLVKYPIAVTIVTAGGQIAADDPVVRKWLDQIRHEVQKRSRWTGAGGVAGFNTITTTGKAPFDVSALNKDYNYSTTVYTVEVLESRP